MLRRLCVDSGAHVVITDQIGARGRAEREENEMGRVLPMTASGLEYFVDVMVELALRQDGFETTRVATVVKSNAPDFPVGLQIENPTFATFLARMGEGPKPAEQPDWDQAPLPDTEPPTDAEPDLDSLLAAADANGLAREQILLAARHYCGVAALEELSADDVSALLDRLEAKYGAPEGSGDSRSGSADDVELRAVKKPPRRKAA